MSGIHVTVRLAFVALAIAASAAEAQRSNGGRVLEGAAVEACQAAPGGSRARRNCEPAAN